MLRIVNNEVTNRYLWGPQVDQLLADEQLGNHVYWALTDHLNTVRDLIVDNGASVSIVKHINYNSFGRVVSDSNTSILELFGNQGKMYETITGLNLHLHRWYDSRIGKWVSEDPSGLTPDVNAARFVGNDVLRLVDPSGLESNELINIAANGYTEKQIQQVKDAFTTAISDINLTLYYTKTYHKRMLNGDKDWYLTPIVRDDCIFLRLKPANFDKEIEQLKKAADRVMLRIDITLNKDSGLHGSTADMKAYVRFYAGTNSLIYENRIYITPLFFKLSPQDQSATIVHELGRLSNRLGTQNDGTWTDVYEWDRAIDSILAFGRQCDKYGLNKSGDDEIELDFKAVYDPIHGDLIQNIIRVR